MSIIAWNTQLGVTAQPAGYFNGSKKLRNFGFAWAPAYLSLFNTLCFSAFLEDYGVLSNQR